ncbi:putative DNA-binding protein [Flavobacterium araucananum]|uniref:AlbA family DNA-binding domain-containing protein n=1 Tax=Flavobacterium araucananum TaxID=946678 RepID=UPI000D7B4BC5|nr:ATP-binding protein [Flavobacterium araucananum]PWJ97390.1 putative DNA-binding protein [Flavobacterium araucananum]
MQKIVEIIEYENESHRVDFKKIEYPLGKDAKKNEILKDFSAFANHLSDDDKFIILGVKEKEDKSKETFGIDNPTDEAKYRQFINENIEPPINFEYNHFNYKNKTICFFKLSENNNRPYLFKKDCKNPIDTKTEFKYGDGFIRVGTSTKKIGRKELDDINENKKKYINRQEDIDVVPVIGKPSNKEINKWDVKYLDLKITNKSNKSIDIDVEILLKKSQDYEILLEDDFLREIQRQENLQKKSSPFLSSVYLNPIVSNMYITSRENETEFIVERNQLKQKFALTLPQNSVNDNVFLESIILLERKSNLIEAQVLVRSDDFTKGALIKNITFET